MYVMRMGRQLDLLRDLPYGLSRLGVECRGDMHMYVVPSLVADVTTTPRKLPVLSVVVLYRTYIPKLAPSITCTLKRLLVCSLHPVAVLPMAST